MDPNMGFNERTNDKNEGGRNNFFLGQPQDAE
jgi:hypothetical protein